MSLEGWDIPRATSHLLRGRHDSWHSCQNGQWNTLDESDWWTYPEKNESNLQIVHLETRIFGAWCSHHSSVSPSNGLGSDNQSVVSKSSRSSCPRYPPFPHHAPALLDHALKRVSSWNTTNSWLPKMEMAWMLKPTIHLVVAGYWTDLLCCLNGTLNPHKVFSMSLEFFTAPFQRSIWTVLDFNIGCLLQCYCCVFWDCKKVCIVLIAIYAIATILKRLFYVQWDDPSIFSEHTFQLQINMKASMFFPPIFLAMKPQLMCSCSTASFRNTNTCHVFVFACVFPPSRMVFYCKLLSTDLFG